MGKHLRLALAVLAWNASTSAQAEEPTQSERDASRDGSFDRRVDLEWNAPPECPDVQFVLSRVHFPADVTAPMKARARITRTEGTYDLLLSTDQQGRVGKRAISATNCRELAEVTAALLSLSLQAAPRSPPPAETARPESGGHSANRPSPGAAPFLDVGALTGVGILPKPSVGPAIRLGARFESVQIELGGYALLPAVAAVDASVSSRHSLLSSAVRICRTWGESWILGPCAGMQIGVLRGEALGVTNPAKAGKPWLSPEVGILAGISEGPWSLVIRPALGTALVRPRFRIEPYGTTFQPGVVFFSGEIYLRVSFGTYP